MMKNKSYIGISFIILIFGIYAIPKIIAGFKNNTIVKENRMSRVQQSLSENKKSDLVTFGKVPDFQFINQDSVKISNDYFKGKVYVVEFFFTTCPTICPIMTKNMSVIANAFDDVDDFAIASFSINPSADTPSVLKAYQKEHGITMKNWQMLTGNRDEIMKLANKGFNLYAAMDDKAPGGFEHSGLFALVDKNGYIRSRKDEFGNPILCYRGISGTRKDETGELVDKTQHQITELKQDILKLLKE